MCETERRYTQNQMCLFSLFHLTKRRSSGFTDLENWPPMPTTRVRSPERQCWHGICVLVSSGAMSSARDSKQGCSMHTHARSYADLKEPGWPNKGPWVQSRYSSCRLRACRLCTVWLNAQDDRIKRWPIFRLRARSVAEYMINYCTSIKFL